MSITPKTHKPNDCEQCLSESNGFLKCASLEVLGEISEAKTVKTYPKGSHVFLNGDEADGVYCISEGVIKVYYSGEAGKDHLLRVAGRGDILGYRAMLSGEPYKASAIVAENATACFIPKQTFNESIIKDPQMAITLLTKLSKEFGGAESRLSAVTDKEAARRVAESLLFLKTSFPKHPWTRKDIAEWASTTPETVMRVLAKFTDKGYIKSEGRRIVLVDETSLNQIALITDD